MTFYECVFDFVFVKSGITTFQFFDRVNSFLKYTDEKENETKSHFLSSDYHP